MPIKDLTYDQTGSLPVIARLYKGDPKPDAFRPGKDLNHFRIKFEERYEEYRPLWEEMYGEQPDSFENVYLVGKTVEDAFPTWMEEWDAKAMLHRCDGETQVMWHNPSTLEYEHTHVICANTCNCKRTGSLSLFFFDFFAATGVLGCVAFSTHSTNDILQLHRYLAFLQGKGFALDSIPFEIGRSDKKISARIEDRDGNAKRMRVSKSLLWIHVEPEFMRDYVLPAMQRVDALPSGTPSPTVIPAIIENTTEAPPPEYTPSDPSGQVWKRVSVWANESVKALFPTEIAFGAKLRELTGANKLVSTMSDAQAVEAVIRWCWMLDKAAVAKMITESGLRDEREVIEALVAPVDYGILDIDLHYREDKRFAWASIIAYKAKYDCKVIERLTGKDKTPDTYELACKIAEQVLARRPHLVEEVQEGEIVGA